MKFEWDENKNQENIRKHGVSFEEAKIIFFNDFVEKPDIDYSEYEDRFIAIGISYYTRELMVSYCYRSRVNNEEVIRIISSRKATEKVKEILQNFPNKKEVWDAFKKRKITILVEPMIAIINKINEPNSTYTFTCAETGLMERVGYVYRYEKTIPKYETKEEIIEKVPFEKRILGYNSSLMKDYIKHVWADTISSL